MSLEIIEVEDINEVISIRFNNILDGLDKYQHININSLKNNKEIIELDFIKIIESFFDLNDGKLIIDFYKKNLTKESISFIKNNLELNEVEYFNNLISLCNNENIYYYVKDKKYISLLTKLNTRELFFITFYFYKYPVTLWGNYNLNFPLFYDENSYIKKYNDIIREII